MTRSRARPLRQAAAAVFAVTTIVPLLIFVWTLHVLEVLSKTAAQIGLGLALAIALLGFQIFRVLMGRMSDLVQSLGRAVEQAARSAQRTAAAPSTAAPDPALATPTPPGEARASVFARPPQPASPRLKPPDGSSPAASSGTEAPVGPAGPSVPSGPTGPVAPPPARSAPTLAVPGLGDVQEVQDLSRAMALLWMAEATGLRGHRVSISILGAPRPITGELVDIADDGLVVRPDGAGPSMVIGYGRVAAIDLERPPDPR